MKNDKINNAPLLFLGGDICKTIYCGFCKSGWLTRGEHSQKTMQTTTFPNNPKTKNHEKTTNPTNNCEALNETYEIAMNELNNTKRYRITQNSIKQPFVQLPHQNFIPHPKTH